MGSLGTRLDTLYKTPSTSNTRNGELKCRTNDEEGEREREREGGREREREERRREIEVHL